MVYLCAISRRWRTRARIQTGGALELAARIDGDGILLHQLRRSSTGAQRPAGRNQIAASAAQDGVLNWEVPYVPGVLKALGSTRGMPAAEFELRTAEKADRIVLLPDVKELHARDRTICHVEVRVADAQGVRVPDADPTMTFEVTGPAEVLGIGNGDLNSIEDCKDLVHKAYQGRALAILQATGARGAVTLKVTSPGLDPAILTLPAR